jgi:uncharacterized protein YkwD
MKVREEQLGRRIVCPGCRERILLPAPPAASGWHYIRERKKYGPISLAQLKSLADRGIVAADDMILPVGARTWIAARSVPGLFTPADAPRTRRGPLTLGIAMIALLAVLVGGGFWLLTRPTAPTRPDPNPTPPQEVAQRDPSPVVPEPNRTPPKEAKPSVEAKKPAPPAEQKKPASNEEKKPVAPEPKANDPAEEKKSNEEKKPSPPEDDEPRRIESVELQAVVDRLNAVRVAAGLGKVALARGDQDVVALRAAQEPGTALEAWLANIPSRLKLLDPALREVGVRLSHNRRGEWSCALALTAHGEDVVLYPYPGQQEVRLSFSGGAEAPDPKAFPGFPVSAMFPPQRKITQAQGWLEDETASPVPFWLSTPEKPLRPGLKHMIGLLPKERLKPGHVYTTKITAQVDGKEWTRTWMFTTEDDSDAGGVWAGKMLQRLREIRKEAKVGDIELDAAMSKGCRLHALYLVRNADHPAVRGLGGHDEDPKLPGYTPEGRDAGKKSVIAFADPTPLDAIEAWLATLYHRSPMLDPRLVRIGFGAARGKNGMWTTCLNLGGLNKGERDRIVCYPEDEQQRVPLTFAIGGEVPNPIPDDKDGKAGFPITALFPTRSKITNATGTLADAAGKRVPAWFSAPEKPANSMYADYQGACLCLIPHDPLAAETTYHVEMSARLDGKPWQRAWKFTTGLGGLTPEEGAAWMLKRLNALRGDAGLGPIRLDSATSRACEQHAHYLARNFETLTKTGVFTDQDPSLPGATPEGRKIAQASQIALATPHPDALADDALGTLLLREQILEPRLRRVGFGCALAPGRGWMSVYYTLDDAEPALAVLPYPEQTDVPFKVSHEGKDVGYPISATFLAAHAPRDLRVRLTGPGDTDVSLTPYALAGSSSVAFLPAAMTPDTKYVVELRYTKAGMPQRHTWTFTTRR